MNKHVFYRSLFELKLPFGQCGIRWLAYLSGAVTKSLFSSKGPYKWPKDLRTCMGGSPVGPQREDKQFGRIQFLANIVKKHHIYIRVIFPGDVQMK